MTDREFVEVVTVKVDGTPLDRDAGLLDLRVDLGLNVVGSATLHFAGAVADVGDHIAKLGAVVEVTPVRGASVFKGEVVGIETTRDGAGDTITTLTALDPLHGLSGHSQVKAHNKVKIDKVIEMLVTPTGLSKDIKATSVTYEYLFQTGTDLDYLDELAERAGLDWWCDADTFKAKQVKVGAPKLEVKASELDRLSVRVSGKRPKQVSVQGWDPTKSQTVKADANLTSDTLGASIGLSGKVAGFEPRVAQQQKTSAIPVLSADEAPIVASSVLTRAAAGAIRADIEGPAMWEVKPGDTVKVTEAGADMSGNYLITAIEHRVSEGTASTRLLAGPRRPTGLGSGDIAAPLHGRTPGIVTATVTNIKDPENKGRVKLKFPGIDESQESEWARVLFMGAGSSAGATVLPEVGDEVLATFEDNDVRRPIVLGSLFTSKTTLPELKVDKDTGKTTHVTLLERWGHKLQLWKDGSKQGITITLQNGAELTMDDKGIRLTGPKGQTTTITQGQSKIELKDSGDITLEGTNVTVNAKNKVAMEGKAGLDAKGAQVNVQGTAKVEVKAPLANVNADGILELKGSLVKIN